MHSFLQSFVIAINVIIAMFVTYAEFAITALMNVPVDPVFNTLQLNRQGQALVAL